MSGNQENATTTFPESPERAAARAPPGAGAVWLLALLLGLDFLLAVVMLATDKNLQTDFGAQPAGSMIAGYYLHWWGVLAIAVIDLVAVVIVGFAASRGTPSSGVVRRRVSIVAALWAALVAVAMVGIVATYSQVGFSSATDFAKYLFVPSPYPYSLSYIPWLYDGMLVVDLLTLAVAVWAFVRYSGASRTRPA